MSVAAGFLASADIRLLLREVVRAAARTLVLFFNRMFLPRDDLSDVSAGGPTCRRRRATT